MCVGCANCMGGWEVHVARDIYGSCVCVCCRGVHLRLVFWTHFLPVHGTVEALGFSLWCHWCLSALQAGWTKCEDVWRLKCFQNTKARWNDAILPAVLKQSNPFSQHWVQLRTRQRQGHRNLQVTVRTTVYASSSPRLSSSQCRVFIGLYPF